MKLSARLVLGTAALVLAATLAVGFFAYRALERSIYPAQLTRMTADARLITERLAVTVQEAAADITATAHSPSIAALIAAMVSGDLQAQARWKEGLGRVFAAWLAAEPEYIQFRFIARQGGGREVVRADRSLDDGAVRLVPEDELQAKGDRPYFAEAMALPPARLYVSDIELNQEYGRIQSPHVPVLRVASPVAGPDGENFGIVILNVDLRLAFERLRVASGPGVVAYVVNANGDYLVHPDREKEFGFDLGRPSRLQDDFPELWQALAPGSTETITSLTVEDAAGESYAAAASSENLSGATWIAVLLLAPRAVVLAPADAILYSTLAAGAGAIIVAVLLSLALARSVARPLDGLARALKRFDHGEPVDLPSDGPSEVQALVDAFRRHIESERLFSVAMQSTSDAVLTENLDGTISAWNPAAEHLFGYSAEEAIGRSISILVPDDQRSEFEKMLRQLRKGQATQAAETVRVTKNGERRQVSLSISPVHSLNGDLAGATVIYRDMTERKRADTMFRIAAEASPAAMIMVDQLGQIELVNSEALEVFGYTREEIVGKPIEMLIPERLRDKHAGLRQSYFEYSERRSMGVGRDLYGLRSDGSEFPVEVGLSPIDTPDGPMVLGMVVDITERRQAAERLEMRTEELRRSNAELQQFAYVASHDLQEPLRMVSSFCTLLKERYGGQLGGEAEEFIDFAVDGAKRMRQLINDLLDYSRLQTRSVPLSTVSCQSAVETALLNLSEAVRENDADIVVHALPEVIGNEGQLVRLFQNLIGNALKFRRVDQAPKVEVSVRPDGPFWEFVVTDNGIGFEPKQTEVIFGVFQRLHTRDEYPGTGIGLAVCKRIVERHGGRIWAESTRGDGAIFHFTLKAAAAAGQDPAGPDDGPQSHNEHQEGTSDVRRVG